MSACRHLGVLAALEQVTRGPRLLRFGRVPFLVTANRTANRHRKTGRIWSADRRLRQRLDRWKMGPEYLSVWIQSWSASAVRSLSNVRGPSEHWRIQTL